MQPVPALPYAGISIMGIVTGPALPNELADRIDSLYEDIKEASSLLVNDDIVLRKQVAAFTTLLVDTLRGVGYRADAYSKSCYLMLDTAQRAGLLRSTVVAISLTDWQLDEWYTVDVWAYPQYNVRVNDPYNGMQAALSAYSGYGIYIQGIQEVISTVHTIRATIDTYRQCKGCHWSSNGGDYCGLGAVPELPTCSQYHHYSMRGLLSWEE
jgi:hypothetical protein